MQIKNIPINSNGTIAPGSQVIFEIRDPRAYKFLEINMSQTLTTELLTGEALFDLNCIQKIDLKANGGNLFASFSEEEIRLYCSKYSLNRRIADYCAFGTNASLGRKKLSQAFTSAAGFTLENYETQTLILPFFVPGTVDKVADSFGYLNVGDITPGGNLNNLINSVDVVITLKDAGFTTAKTDLSVTYPSGTVPPLYGGNVSYFNEYSNLEVDNYNPIAVGATTPPPPIASVKTGKFHGRLSMKMQAYYVDNQISDPLLQNPNMYALYNSYGIPNPAELVLTNNLATFQISEGNLTYDLQKLPKSIIKSIIFQLPRGYKFRGYQLKIGDIIVNENTDNVLGFDVDRSLGSANSIFRNSSELHDTFRIARGYTNEFMKGGTTFTVNPSANAPTPKIDTIFVSSKENKASTEYSRIVILADAYQNFNDAINNLGGNLRAQFNIYKELPDGQKDNALENNNIARVYTQFLSTLSGR